MSEFPKSYRWHTDPTDVITFNGPEDNPFCKSGMRWWYHNGALPRLTDWIEITPEPEETPAETDELTLLRTFRDTVIQATQDTPNHRLPQVIFAADKAVRKVNQQQESIT